MTAGAINHLETLRKREDFLRVQAAPRVGCETLVLHMLPNPSLPEGRARVGFTVTKRCGGAVERNRIKRRLRALACSMLVKKGHPGTDYVLIGKPGTGHAPYDTLKRDLKYALHRIHKPKDPA